MSAFRFEAALIRVANADSYVVQKYASPQSKDFLRAAPLRLRVFALKNPGVKKVEIAKRTQFSSQVAVIKRETKKIFSIL
jgi:hypothetical protein